MIIGNTRKAQLCVGPSHERDFLSIGFHAIVLGGARNVPIASRR